MSDYALELTVRNGRIRRALQQAGFKNVAQFCKAHGISRSGIDALLNLKEPPITTRGEWRKEVLRLCDALVVTPDDLFSDAQRVMAVKTNSATIEITEAQMQQIAGEGFEEIRRLTASTIEPDEPIESQELKASLLTALDTLPKNCRDVLVARYGLDGSEGRSVEEIAELRDISRSRVQQIEQKALRILRRPRPGVGSFRERVGR
jgi:RNA polymerase sigma factor (sigma-70 family)